MFAAPSHPNTLNLAESMVRELALGILRGDPPVGAKLPSVRSLATRFHTTVPTAQRVLASLDAASLVDVRHGGGATVRDPRRCGLSLAHLWFDALSDDPDRAAQLLDDLLALRRMVAARLLRRGRAQLIEHLPQLAELWSALAGDLPFAARVETDIAFAWALLELTDDLPASAVFEAAERVLRQSPGVAEALYADPARHQAAMGAVAEAIASPHGDIDAALAPWDRTSVERFHAYLKEVC